MSAQHKWTAEDLQLLKEMHQTMTVEQIASRLRLSIFQVHGALKRYKIAVSKYKKWTAEDLDNLRELRRTYSIRQMAEKLGMHPDRVRSIMAYYGITQNGQTLGSRFSSPCLVSEKI